jgi:hypothetical protein
MPKLQTFTYNSKLSTTELNDLFSSEIDNIPLEKLTIKNITFPSYEDAIEYLEDMIHLYPAISIKYLEPLEKFENSELYQQLVDKLNIAIKNYLDFPEFMIQKLSEQKSGTKGCTKCKSSINRDFFVKKASHRLLNIIETSEEQHLDLEDFLNFKMKTIECPICDDKDFVMTETDYNKLSTLRNKINDAEKKLKEEQISFQIKNGHEEVGLIGFDEDYQS